MLLLRLPPLLFAPDPTKKLPWLESSLRFPGVSEERGIPSYIQSEWCHGGPSGWSSLHLANPAWWSRVKDSSWASASKFGLIKLLGELS